tara:strand:- start:5431 stop:5658 length:228 start_codon:yes stop_codon:yes gene_type:complete
MQIDLQKYIDEYYEGSVYEFSAEAKLYENPARAVWSHITKRLIELGCLIDLETGKIIYTRKTRNPVVYKCKEWRK